MLNQGRDAIVKTQEGHVIIAPGFTSGIAVTVVLSWRWDFGLTQSLLCFYQCALPAGACGAHSPPLGSCLCHWHRSRVVLCLSSLWQKLPTQLG